MTRKWNPKELDVTVTTASCFDVEVRVTDYIPAGKDSGHPTDPPPDSFQVEWELVDRDKFWMDCIVVSINFNEMYKYGLLEDFGNIAELVDRLAELEIGDERVRDAIEASRE